MAEPSASRILLKLKETGANLADAPTVGATGVAELSPRGYMQTSNAEGGSQMPSGNATD